MPLGLRVLRKPGDGRFVLAVLQGSAQEETAAAEPGADGRSGGPVSLSRTLRPLV